MYHSIISVEKALIKSLPVYYDMKREILKG